MNPGSRGKETYRNKHYLNTIYFTLTVYCFSSHFEEAAKWANAHTKSYKTMRHERGSAGMGQERGAR
jgi:hypothetical protein